MSGKDVAPWCFILHVNRDTDLDEAWSILQEGGMAPLYMEESDGSLAKIYVNADCEWTAEELLDRYAFIDYIDQEELGGIDWESQWEAHGLNFHDGHVHLDMPKAVSEKWKELKLLPGVGFGDLSHPTTRLVVKMMDGHMQGKNVVDIGCGSGILALCAVALGAKHVDAIDIDSQALKHSHENAELNGMESQISFYLPQEFTFQGDDPVILMNMIAAEQQEAWSQLESLHHKHGICFVSGILADQKETYLEITKNWGWQLQDEQHEDGWLGLLFKR